MSLGKCIIGNCNSEAGVTYPLLSGSPSFCNNHHNESYAGKYGCDFSPPDDFDIPDFWNDDFDGSKYGIGYDDTGHEFWTMKNGSRIRIKDMEFSHIKNCIRLLFKTDEFDLIEIFEEELARRKDKIKKVFSK